MTKNYGIIFHYFHGHHFHSSVYVVFSRAEIRLMRAHGPNFYKDLIWSENDRKVSYIEDRYTSVLELPGWSVRFAH